MTNPLEQKVGVADFGHTVGANHSNSGIAIFVRPDYFRFLVIRVPSAY